MPERKVFRPDVMNTTVLLTTHDEHYVSTDNLRELLNLTSDEAYLQLAKLIAAAEPQVFSLEEIAKSYTCSQCEQPADVTGFCSDSCRWESDGISEEQVNQA